MVAAAFLLSRFEDGRPLAGIEHDDIQVAIVVQIIDAAPRLLRRRGACRRNVRKCSRNRACPVSASRFWKTSFGTR